MSTTIITCWGKNQNGPFNSTNSTPCGPLNRTNPRVPCCSAGDTCLQDSICYRQGSLTGGTGYYTAECTDENYGYGCANRCVDVNIPEIVYNQTTGLWACCGKDLSMGNPTCNTPTDETFDAPDPQGLISYYVAPALGSSATALAPWSSSMSTMSSTAASSPVSSTSGANPTVSSVSNSGGRLSSGAAAVIEVAVAVGILLLVGLPGFFVFKNGRKWRAEPHAESASAWPKLIDPVNQGVEGREFRTQIGEEGNRYEAPAAEQRRPELQEDGVKLPKSPQELHGKYVVK